MKRTWDESNSPQWRYLLSRESEQRKASQRIFTGGGEEEQQHAVGEVKRNKLGKKAKRAREKTHQHSPKEKQFTKLGKEIVYSASPGPESHFTKQQPTPSSTLLKNE